MSYSSVQPQHERRKYLSLESKEKPRLLKFAGLGRYGRSKRERAERLAGAGWGPPVVGLSRGFLVTEFVERRSGFRRRTRSRFLANNVTGNTLRVALFLIGISFASLVPA
ncbi:MAG: hypothetical protein MPW16_11695 [Candidatus Manganitrophus sp.]|nr:MAG: hypothetical protein MPW16_11695 [Candidatus Manganitrophus sp.]